MLFHVEKPEQLTASALVDKPLTHTAASANNDFFIDLSLSLYFFGQKDAVKKLKNFFGFFLTRLRFFRVPRGSVLIYFFKK